MAKVLLKRTEQHYADKMEEAAEIVAEAKEDENLVTQKISEKHNKYGTYHLVDLAFNYQTPKDIMETQDGKKDDVPDGQMSIEEVAAEEKLPEFEDPFAEKKDVPDEDLPY